MSSAPKYAVPVDVNERWNVAVNSPTQFSWEYDDGRDRLLNLYQKGKDKQWDTTKRIDWSIPVEPHNPIGLPEETDVLLEPYGEWAGLASVYLLAGFRRGFVPLPLAA